MTKTLTEQWREGTLPEGYYYISFDETDNKPIIYKCTEYRMNNCRWHNEEVLTPVPNYEEYKRLQEQIKEANEIISTYRCYDDTDAGKATEYCKKWGVK
jgi:hypothetical protein